MTTDISPASALPLRVRPTPGQAYPGSGPFRVRLSKDGALPAQEADGDGAECCCAQPAPQAGRRNFGPPTDCRARPCTRLRVRVSLGISRRSAVAALRRLAPTTSPLRGPLPVSRQRPIAGASAGWCTLLGRVAGNWGGSLHGPARSCTTWSNRYPASPAMPARGPSATSSAGSGLPTTPVSRCGHCSQGRPARARHTCSWYDRRSSGGGRVTATGSLPGHGHHRPRPRSTLRAAAPREPR